LAGYRRQHLVTYLHLLDAEEKGADWQEVAKISCTSTPNA
jgi:hypothetical protein